MENDFSYIFNLVLIASVGVSCIWLIHNPEASIDPKSIYVVSYFALIYGLVCGYVDGHESMLALLSGLLSAIFIIVITAILLFKRNE